MTVAPVCGSSYTPVVIRKSPESTPLPKILRPVMRKPSATFSSLPEPASQSEPPVEISTSFSAATRRSIGSGPLFPDRQR